MLHKDALPIDRHALHAWEVADIAARDALSVTASDVGKVCRVTAGTGAHYLLSSDSPKSWDMMLLTSASSGVLLFDSRGGTTNDASVLNKNAQIVMRVPTGTRRVVFEDYVEAQVYKVTTPTTYVAPLASEAYLRTSATGGASLTGNGSSYDIELLNKNGAYALRVPTGGQQVNFGGIGMFAGQVYINATQATALPMSNSNASPNGWRMDFTAAAPNNTGGNWFWICTDTVGNKAFLSSNGGLNNFSAFNTNLACDASLKTFSGPLEPQRAKLRAIEIRMGRYIDGPDDELPMLTAQQLQTVYPELVCPVIDPDENGGKDTGRLGIYEQRLSMIHMKVTQEHDDEINALRSEIEELKALVRTLTKQQ